MYAFRLSVDEDGLVTRYVRTGVRSSSRRQFLSACDPSLLLDTFQSALGQSAKCDVQLDLHRLVTFHCHGGRELIGRCPQGSLQVIIFDRGQGRLLFIARESSQHMLQIGH